MRFAVALCQLNVATGDNRNYSVAIPHQPSDFSPFVLEKIRYCCLVDQTGICLFVCLDRIRIVLS